MTIIQKPLKIINPTEDLTKDKVGKLLDPSTMRGIPTGIEGLDKLILGIKPGSYVLSATRGTGKSWFALQLARCLWQSSRIKTLFFTLEMSVDDLQKRCVQSWSGLSEEQMLDNPNVEKGLELLREGFLHFIPAYEEKLDYETFEAEIEKATAKGFKFFILDHLHLVRGASSEKRDEVLAHWANEVKMLANRLGVTILLLAQPRKMNTLGKVVTSDDVKGTGAITDAADVVLTLNRERKDPREKQSSECFLSVEKNRLGGKMYEGLVMIFTETGEFIEKNTYLEKENFLNLIEGHG